MAFVAVLVSACGGGPADRAGAGLAPQTAPAVREGFIPVEGGRVFFRVVGDGEAIPLVVLHGGPGAPHDAQTPLEVLADERPVVFYDQLGCGRSDRPDDPSLWRLSRFVEELETVRRELHLDRIHLLGHSWGSMLALEYYLHHPDRVASLILDSPYMSVKEYQGAVASLVEALPADVKATLARHEAAGTTSSPEYESAMLVFLKRHLYRGSWDPLPEPMVRQLAGFNKVIYRTMWGTSEWNANGNLSTFERLDRLGEVHVPTLFLVGEFDEVRPESVARYHELLPGSEVVVIEQASHYKYLEQPEAYMAAVRNFLRGR
jgi:proline iminopeptidase